MYIFKEKSECKFKHKFSGTPIAKMSNLLVSKIKKIYHNKCTLYKLKKNDNKYKFCGTPAEKHVFLFYCVPTFLTTWLESENFAEHLLKNMSTSSLF